MSTRQKTTLKFISTYASPMDLISSHSRPSIMQLQLKLLGRGHLQLQKTNKSAQFAEFTVTNTSILRAVEKR